MSSAQGEPSPVHRFDSASVPAGQRFDQWCDLFSPIFDVSLPDRDAREVFHGQLETHHLGGVLLGRCATVTQIFQRNAQVIARSGMDHYLVQLLCGGTSQGAMGTREVDVRPGDVCVFDLAQTIHTIDRDIDALTLCLPRELLAPLVAEPDGLHGIVLRGDTPVGAVLANYIGSLGRIVTSLSAREAVGIARGTTAFIAGCLGPAVSSVELARERMEVTRLIAIKRFIESQLANPELDPGRLCETFGLSRPTLYRLFEPMGGVAGYILQRRLARSLADLTSARRQRIADIAHRWGFSSEATFSRAFRAAYGMSPREARSGEWRAGLPMENGTNVLKRWFQDLAVV